MRSGDLTALRLRCSALAKVSFRSLVRARVKWLPPSGIGRCQMMRSPSVMTRLLLSAPMSRADDAALLAALASASGRGAGLAAEQVEGDEVAQGQRRHLHQMDLDADFLEVLQIAVDHVALHGEQADFRLDEAVGQLADAELLVVPDDLVEVERDLLLGLERTMSGIFFSSTGGSLTKRARPLWPGTLMATVSPRRVLRDRNLCQRLAGQLVGVGVGLAEDLGMLDVVEGGGGDLAVDDFEADGLEGALAEIDAPDAGRRRLAEVEEGAAGLGRDAGFGLGFLLLGRRPRSGRRRRRRLGRLSSAAGLSRRRLRPASAGDALAVASPAGLMRLSAAGLAGLAGRRLGFGFGRRVRFRFARRGVVVMIPGHSNLHLPRRSRPDGKGSRSPSDRAG